MDIRSKTMVGLPVFTTTHGEKLGQVKDYIFHPEKRRVIAFVITQGKPFGEDKLLPLENMHSLGHGAITVTDDTMMIKKGEREDIDIYLKKMANIVGIKVMTMDGSLLGVVNEFFMDTASGAITRLSLSAGLISQWLKGKNYLDVGDVEVFGSDVILAKNTAIPTISQKAREEKPIKEASSNIIWNKGVESLQKAKNYVQKPKEEESVKEDEETIQREKKNPLTSGTKTQNTKGKIYYKDSL